MRGAAGSTRGETRKGVEGSIIGGGSAGQKGGGGGGGGNRCEKTRHVRRYRVPEGEKQCHGDGWLRLKDRRALVLGARCRQRQRRRRGGGWLPHTAVASGAGGVAVIATPALAFSIGASYVEVLNCDCDTRVSCVCEFCRRRGGGAAGRRERGQGQVWGWPLPSPSCPGTRSPATAAQVLPTDLRCRQQQQLQLQQEQQRQRQQRATRTCDDATSSSCSSLAAVARDECSALRNLMKWEAVRAAGPG